MSAIIKTQVNVSINFHHRGSFVYSQNELNFQGQYNLVWL